MHLNLLAGLVAYDEDSQSDHEEHRPRRVHSTLETTSQKSAADVRAFIGVVQFCFPSFSCFPFISARILRQRSQAVHLSNVGHLLCFLVVKDIYSNTLNFRFTTACEFF